MILPILKHKAPQLRQVAVPFEFDNPTHHMWRQDLQDTLLACHNAAGLAALQIGRMVRVFYAMTGNFAQAFINPTVIETFGSMQTDYEECLSLPNVRALVSRPYEAIVSWYDVDGREYEGELAHRALRTFLHELDHLNGVLISDRKRNPNISYEVK